MWKKVGAWNQAQAEANGYEGRPDAAQVVDQAGSRTSCQPGPRGRSEARHLRDVQFVRAAIPNTGIYPHGLFFPLQSETVDQGGILICTG
ncbi:hypothetical protein VTN31DRAFT_7499 [Thermomyces dupontii]|uniref:uncharacterized protein n=1 Tax=Talaromyces thermophilus TaxID=28565 RepID=UPI00374237CB